MKKHCLIQILVIPLICCCGKVYPVTEGLSESFVESFTLDCIPDIRVYTLGGAAVSSKENYTLGGSCVLEYSETSSATGESVRHSVDLGGFSIKGRGNSTWNCYPKKPYLVKFDMRQEVLGMGSGRTWCLLANWMDQTLLRNDVAFEIASRCSSLAWTPRGEFVELWLNGKDMGLYYLCPHISLGKDRVDGGKDGVIFELDTYYDEPYRFRSLIDLPVMIKDFEAAESEPRGVMSVERFNFIKDAFLKAESLIKSAEAVLTEEYTKYFDLESLVDFYLVNEVVGNGELCHPKSTYLYYNGDDGKYYSGPVWDFDWATMIPNVGGLIDREFIWYKYLFQDPLFIACLKERWEVLKSSLGDIGEYIETREDWIAVHAEKNFEMWPITQTVNGDEGLPFHAAVGRLAQSLEVRISEMDKSIRGL